MASSFPKHCFSSQELCDALIQNHYHNNLKEEDEHFVRHIFKRSLIERCHVSVPLDRAFVRMSRTEYTDHVKSSIERISVEAATMAFEQLERLYGLDRSCITHLVFGTMTGTIAAPSMDVQLSQKLGLSPFVQRLNIEAMGCLTGVRLTGLCQDLIGASKNKRVLLITCDIRSALGHTMPPFEAQAGGRASTNSRQGVGGETRHRPVILSIRHPSWRAESPRKRWGDLIAPTGADDGLLVCDDSSRKPLRIFYFGRASSP